MFYYLLAQATEAVHQAADTVAKTTFADKIKEMSTMSLDTLLQKATHGIISLVIKILICLAIYYVGRWAINFLIKLLRKILDKRTIDPSVCQFLSSLLRVVLWIILVAILVSILGINTTSIVAMFASAGLAFGIALSGTLQNFAGGVMILLFKPFRVGDYIEAQGQAGTVKEIQIINTIITTPDNKTIYLPNGPTFSGIINNSSKQATRRVEWTFSIGYGDSYDKAKALILEMAGNDKRILKDPAPFVALNNLGESSVDIVVRVWVNAADFWDVFFDLNEKVYKTFPKENLHIPFPQMDVYVHQAEGETPAPAMSTDNSQDKKA